MSAVWSLLLLLCAYVLRLQSARDVSEVCNVCVCVCVCVVCVVVASGTAIRLVTISCLVSEIGLLFCVCSLRWIVRSDCWLFKSD